MLKLSEETVPVVEVQTEDAGYVSYRDVLLRNIPIGYAPKLPNGSQTTGRIPTTIITTRSPDSIFPFSTALPPEIQWLLQSIVHLRQACPVLPWRHSFMAADSEDIRGISPNDLIALEGSPFWAQGHDAHGRFFVAVRVQDALYDVKGILTIFQRYIPVDNSVSVNLKFDTQEKQALNNCWKIAYNGTPSTAQALAMQEGYWQQGDIRTEYIKSLVDNTVRRRHYGQ